MSKSILYCFTSSFPYGNKETFFANELPYLAEAFHKIVIIPMYNPYSDSDVRKLPINVTYQDPSVPQNKLKRIYKGLFSGAPINNYINDFFKFQVFRSKFRFLKWINSLLVYRVQYNQIKKKLQEHDDHDNVILYSYWAEAPIFSTSLLRNRFKILRLHRVDVYLEENFGYLPIRQQIYDQSNLLIPISTNIKDLLSWHYGISDNKIFISRLGTIQPPIDVQNQHRDRSLIRIVTCSRIEKVKRLDYLLKCLSDYQGERMIQWHHFGDGTLQDELESQVIQFESKFFNVTFHGWKSQDEIYQFYINNYIDWFVNVSSSEGIPVSIMEAMSFGIPVIATNVGGTGEIVNDQTGILLNRDFKNETLLEGLLGNYGDGYSKKRVMAQKQWEEHYNAHSNYTKLVQLFWKEFSKFEEGGL